MKLFISVKSGKRTTRVQKIDDTHFVVDVTARPERGRANDAVLKALAEHLDIPVSRISIISGHTAKKKIAKIL